MARLCIEMKTFYILYENVMFCYTHMHFYLKTHILAKHI